VFTLLPGRTTLDIEPEHVVAIIESLNTPNISIPDVGTEPTKAWLIGWLTPAGGTSLSCVLLQTESRRAFLYASQPTEVALDSYSQLEHESIQFVESMGFMLDNVNFRARTAFEQRALFDSLPFLCRSTNPAGVGPSRPGIVAAQGTAAMTKDMTKAPDQRTALLRLLVSY
jgi:hypothetical protein